MTDASTLGNMSPELLELTPIQANRTLALVRKMFNWAISRDIVERNPCTQVIAPGKERQRERVLNGDEIRAVWHVFDELGPVMGGMFKLQLVTGQRGGEVKHMRWRDLELDAGWWTVPSERSKNNLCHRVPLSRLAMSELTPLKDLTGDHEWVFASPARLGRPISNIQRATQRVRTLSGVKDFIPHDLRRTAATCMTSMGISRLVVAKILNHMEQGVTRVYDRYSYDAEKRRALDAWAQKLELIFSDSETTVIPFPARI